MGIALLTLVSFKYTCHVMYICYVVMCHWAVRECWMLIFIMQWRQCWGCERVVHCKEAPLVHSSERQVSLADMVHVML